MLRYFFILPVIAAALACSSCRSGPEESPKADARTAVAILNPTEGNEVKGMVTFTQLEDGVQIIAEISGLTPGEHGFHIHEFGDCSAPDGSSAGGHYNPTDEMHGGPDSSVRHVGDLGNVIADSTGNAKYERVDTVISLTGPDSIIGKSVIVHADADDYVTQPTGNAGKRLACGVIVAN
ncbi:MAG: superoxide dismutase family protein [Chlamydiales bacterium]|nr:superoxide dismutase family protein [Chlamydiia bacterium]MCP5508129.1 superoxide dismutase family protein [Chlamydiales bacterium]